MIGDDLAISAKKSVFLFDWRCFARDAHTWRGEEANVRYGWKADIARHQSLYVCSPDGPSANADLITLKFPYPYERTSGGKLSGGQGNVGSDLAFACFFEPSTTLR